MDRLHLDQLLLLTLISSTVHNKFFTQHSQLDDVTLSISDTQAPVEPFATSQPLPDVTRAEPHHTPIEPLYTSSPLSTAFIPPEPTSEPMKKETHHTIYDTLSFILPVMMALQRSPFVRMALLTMGFWEKFNRKLKALREVRSMLAQIGRVALSLLEMWYPVGGIKDVEEVWDSIVARKRRRSKGVDHLAADRHIGKPASSSGTSDRGEEEKSDGNVLPRDTAVLGMLPISQRRKRAAGPEKLLMKNRHEQEATFLSPLGSNHIKECSGGYRKRFMDIDLPVVCPPTA